LMGRALAELAGRTEAGFMGRAGELMARVTGRVLVG